MTGTAFARDFYNLFPKASQELFSLLGSVLWELFCLQSEMPGHGGGGVWGRVEGVNGA